MIRVHVSEGIWFWIPHGQRGFEKCVYEREARNRTVWGLIDFCRTEREMLDDMAMLLPGLLVLF